MAADDVASAVGRVVVGTPVNGTVEVGGPERFRLDQLVRTGLAARNDPRKVIADPTSRYYGVAVTDNSLVPDPGARFGTTYFANWLSESAPQVTAAKLQPTTETER